jgi:hypothetical protein
MATYLLAYHGGSMPETEEEGAKIMAGWTEWYGKLGAAVVDGGNPVGQNTTIASDGSVKNDGGANPVTGYTIISAAGIDAAVDMAKGCPILDGGGSIEVAETIPMM